MASTLAAIGNQLTSKDEKRIGSPTKGLTAVPEAEALVPPTSPVEDYDPTIGAKPFSPFYRHATPSITLGRLGLKNKDSAGATKNATDIEYGERCRESGESGNRRESKLWKEKKRHCDWLRNLPRGQRMVIKAAIAIGTVGTMVAIALGITVAVGGGVWRSDHQQSAIG
ncbi:hypothetical protein BDV25DRAFT_153520 [Aspergillus avenaceus]|uniref:Uncharacterized protein n=1 Tax=Aspergillus avenaceus TaxID=36643 RepID=A0A5N6TWZ0_ASPAV|nr:hypothetical protein BDV25DRAFT_153520 [Aspergillus avenaceus]